MRENSFLMTETCKHLSENRIRKTSHKNSSKCCCLTVSRSISFNPNETFRHKMLFIDWIYRENLNQFNCRLLNFLLIKQKLSKLKSENGRFSFCKRVQGKFNLFPHPRWVFRIKSVIIYSHSIQLIALLNLKQLGENQSMKFSSPRLVLSDILSLQFQNSSKWNWIIFHIITVQFDNCAILWVECRQKLNNLALMSTIIAHTFTLKELQLHKKLHRLCRFLSLPFRRRLWRRSKK